MSMRYETLFPPIPCRNNRLAALQRGGLFFLIVLFVAALIFPVAAASTTLQENIAALFIESMDIPPQARPSLQVSLLTPPAQRATLCATPALSLSGGLSRLPGVHSVMAQCGAQRRFIQVSLTVTASWWQATRAIAPGQIVEAQQIRAQRGSLAHAPTGLIFDARRIVGRVALRAVRPGEALVESQLRPPRVIRAGERVEVIYIGDGFRISAAGKALDNAALHQRLRIQTAAGQIITAIATATDRAEVAAG